MRIAYVSPLPPLRTGIADYSAALLPYLARVFDRVDVYATERSDVLVDGPDVHPVGDLPERWRTYDLCVYHIGNNQSFHRSIYELALEYPGVVVLHDYFLHHLLAGLTIGGGDFRGYLREVAYARGAAGAELAYEAAVDWAHMPLFDEPLNSRLIDVSLGVLVHSRYAFRLAKSHHPGARIAYIPAPYGPEMPDDLSRDELGLPEGALLVTLAGMPNTAKRTDVVMQAIAALGSRFPQLRCAVIGDLLQGLGEPGVQDLQGRLLEIGYVPSLTRFLAFLNASDVIVNLRYPSVGEASALTLRAMALGKPVVVSNTGWYADLPSDVCVKLDHTFDDGEDAGRLADALADLLAHPDATRLMAERGRSYVQQEHNSERVASEYEAVLRAWRGALYG